MTAIGLAGLASCHSDGNEPAAPPPTAKSVPTSTATTQSTQPAPTVESPPTEPRVTIAPSSTTSLAGTETTGGVDGPVIFGAVSPEGEEALAIGAVEQEGDCLLLAGSSANEPRPVIVWQFGTSWDDGGNAVLLPDGTAVAVGATISASGGFHASDALGQFVSSPEAIAQVGQCVEHESSDNVFVIQHPVEAAP